MVKLLLLLLDQGGGDGDGGANMEEKDDDDQVRYIVSLPAFKVMLLDLKNHDHLPLIIYRSC